MATKVAKGERFVVEVAELEFYEGGTTLWVHGPQGATVLRIKTMGKITVQRDCENVCAHSDMTVAGDIHVCIPGGRRKKRKLAIA